MDARKLAFDFVEHCSTGPDPNAVLSRLDSYAKGLGFDHFILSGLPSPNQRFERFVLLNHWPREWYQRFTERNYFAVDGVGQWALRSHQPFTYSEVPTFLRLPEAARAVRAEAAAFGLVDGFVVPIRSTGHGQSGMSLSCSCRCDLGPHDRTALHLIALYAEGFVRQALGTSPCHQRLTRREREVLAWAAEGKTAWEISVILSVSERTIAKHLEHVRAKLNVATTAQAVAEGLRSGEIAL